MHRFFLGLSKAMAYLGGAVLSALVGIVVLSVIGREINGFLHADFIQNNVKGLADFLLGIRVPGPWGEMKIGPVKGDYELVEAGMAFTIFCFLPLTQITGGHAAVDLFTSWMSDRSNRILTLIIDITFAIVLVIIAMQLYQGMMGKYVRCLNPGRCETTFLLEFPKWWAYAASLVGAVMAAIVSIYIALARIGEAVTGRHLIPSSEGADH